LGQARSQGGDWGTSPLLDEKIPSIRQLGVFKKKPKNPPPPRFRRIHPITYLATSMLNAILIKNA